MFRSTYFALLIAILALIPQIASAQLSGSRGGVYNGGGSSGAVSSNLRVLSQDVAESMITIEGTSELRVKPTEIRVVLAVTSDEKTSKGCSRIVKETIKTLTDSWKAIGVGEEKINDDFIAVLPRYEWKIEEQNGKSVGVEFKAGYRMQTNVHIAVKDEATAMQVLEKAFDAGVTDIIAFDYWSSELESSKIAARKKATEAARSKADTMLVLFDEKPIVINVQEQTSIQFPATMYESFTNAHSSTAIPPNRRDIPFIPAHRPKNTYYRGPAVDVDAMSKELAMKPEISIHSTVRIYYRSPAADLRVEAIDKK